MLNSVSNSLLTNLTCPAEDKEPLHVANIFCGMAGASAGCFTGFVVSNCARMTQAECMAQQAKITGQIVGGSAAGCAIGMAVGSAGVVAYNAYKLCNRKIERIDSEPDLEPAQQQRELIEREPIIVQPSIESRSQGSDRLRAANSSTQTENLPITSPTVLIAVFPVIEAGAPPSYAEAAKPPPSYTDVIGEELFQPEVKKQQPYV